MTAPIDYQTAPAEEPLPPAKPLLPRIAVAVAMVGLLLFVLIGGHSTSVGQRLMDNPHSLAREVREFVSTRPVLSVAAFAGIYLILAELALPVWWLQILGGIGFGLFYGVVICLIASSVGSVLTAATSRWLAADFFHRRVERKILALKDLDHKLGHNGFLVVMATRLTHFLPFGLCNYAFGILEIPFRDIFVGTILGGIPATVVYVAIGVGSAPLRNWRFDLAVGAVNVVLLVPMALRYTRPEWFKKWGLE